MKTQVKKYKEPSKPVGRVAELFAGVGGFRIGLAEAGWKTVFSNQWEPSTKVQHASDVYVANFGEEGHSNEDIAKVKKIPAKFDLLVGGFPCQDYSVAKTLNSAKGLKGKKGVLWWEILRLVEIHQPKLIFLENVDRLLKSPASQRGRDFAIMLRTLGDAGYDVEWRAVSASDYGFPQRRIRVFIIGRKNSSKNRVNDIEMYLSKTGVLARALPIITAGKFERVIIEKDLEKLSRNFNKKGTVSPFQNSGFYTNGVATTVKSMPKYSGNREVLKDIIEPDDSIPDEYWVPENRLKEWKYLKGAKAIERVHKKSGHKYKYAEGKMAFPDLLSNPSRTILTGEGGSSPSRFKHILKTQRGYRRLTPIELERLNGFPDNWTSHDAKGQKVSDSKRAFFMGNALIIGLISLVGKELVKEI